MLKTGEEFGCSDKLNRLIILTSSLSSHCPLLDGLSNLPMDVISSHFSISGHLGISASSRSFTCLFCSIPGREKDAQSCPFKSHYKHLKMYIYIIPLVMAIAAQKGVRVVARKRKGGNATVAEVCSVNKLTFQNICHWGLLSYLLSAFFFP